MPTTKPTPAPAMLNCQPSIIETAALFLPEEGVDRDAGLVQDRSQRALGHVARMIRNRGEAVGGAVDPNRSP
jgi:hypothetical protein